MAGASSWAAIAQWAATAPQAAAVCPTPPSKATFRRVLTALDVTTVEAALTGWVTGHQGVTAQQPAAGPKAERRQVLAVDGKMLRGSAPRSTPEQVAIAASGGGRTHLVAACDHASGVT